MGVSKNRGKNPKMDGENNGKPYEQMDDLGGFPPIFGSTPICWFPLEGSISREASLNTQNSPQDGPRSGTKFPVRSGWVIVIGVWRGGCIRKRKLFVPLPKTNKSHLKIDGWNAIVSFWVSAYFQGRDMYLLVSGRVNSE